MSSDQSGQTADLPSPIRKTPSGTLKHFTAGDGTRIAYRVWGSPATHTPTVLCLAGLSRNSRDFEDIAEALQDSHRVVALDYRGRGESAYAADWRTYTPTAYLDDIRHLLTVESVHNVVVVGTSLGAYLGWGMAAVSPSAVKGLVMNDVGLDVPDEGMAPILTYLSETHRFQNYSQAADHLKQVMPPMSFESDQRWIEFAEATFKVEAALVVPDWDLDIIKPFKEVQQDQVDLRTLFKATFPFPTLLVRGSESTFLSPAMADEMANLHPNLTAISAPGVGHAPQLTEKEVFEPLLSFIRAL